MFSSILFRSPTFTQCNFYTAHECLLLPYEQALTRQDSITNRWYDCSAHMLWVGERTRQLVSICYYCCFIRRDKELQIQDHAHLHFVAGVGNPVGIKVSDKASPEELLQLLTVSCS